MTAPAQAVHDNELCLYCDQRLRPWLADSSKRGYDGHGLFCTLRCGYSWARRVATDHMRTGVLYPRQDPRRS